jgi:hypothetical protein
MVGAVLDKVASSDNPHDASPSEHSPWREVDWIFRDGEVIAIQRLGHETRVRTA